MIPPGTPLTAKQQQVINWIYEKWMAGYGFPSKTQFRNVWPDFDLNESLQHDIFMKALYNRGISPPGEIEDGLTTEQMAAIAVVCNFADNRSRAAKLKSIGITATKWQGWMKNKYFKEYLHSFSAANFEDNLHVVHEGLLKAAEKGSVEAAKFYMEVTGRYTAGSNETQNIKIILAKVIESIQKHVRDPNVLREIAQDFEVIMSGGTPQPVQITAPVLDI